MNFGTQTKISPSLRVALVLGLFASAASAQTNLNPAPLTLEALVSEVLEKNPELAFYQAEIAAAKGEQRTATVLANPELSTSLGAKRAKDAAGNVLGEGAAWAALFALVVLVVAPLTAQEKLNADINAKIRQEEASHSQIMRTLHMFTDVYGPRVTGSPNHKEAADFAIKQMASWGFTNGHLEPWDFGHPGWVNERFSAHIIAPVKDQLTCEVVAWTPGTNGPVAAHAYQLITPEHPTADELTTFLNGAKDKVKGQIVLVGSPVAVPVNLNPPAKRRAMWHWKKMASILLC